ncbi:MAG TPA: hypothetical protein VHL14_14500, partial [Steroidobacteraceae bacterium]|nr:hypothetical protein [Steroidobacteraceae bacterium]
MNIVRITHIAIAFIVLGACSQSSPPPPPPPVSVEPRPDPEPGNATNSETNVDTPDTSGALPP